MEKRDVPHDHFWENPIFTFIFFDLLQISSWNENKQNVISINTKKIDVLYESQAPALLYDGGIYFSNTWCCYSTCI